jgi:hypothetical protein
MPLNTFEGPAIAKAPALPEDTYFTLGETAAYGSAGLVVSPLNEAT